MRSLTRTSLPRAQRRAGVSVQRTTYPCPRQHTRELASVREKELRGDDVWFTASVPRAQGLSGPGSGRDHKANDERTLKLGKTIRILHEKLPSVLVSPLPQEILSPQITLKLFPSTHPHLPAVSGKIAYTAALWTSPVAWGRVPVLGSVKLVIESERMVKNGGFSSHTSSSAGKSSEKLIVRWKTCQKPAPSGVSSSIDKITEWLGGDAVPKNKEFHGLFLFEFDEEGRILNHVIEHVEEGTNWENTTKVISVTDWLLGRAWGRRPEVAPGLALGYCEIDERHEQRHRRNGR